MKFSDLLRMSSTNLLRRKLRTVLTVLGVVIGTASIVVMVSLGLGLRKISLEQIEQFGGLTTINVYYYEYAMNSSGSSEEQTQRTNDEVVEQMAQIPHVEIASPILNCYAMAKQGAYEGSFSIRGMTTEALASLDLDTAE